MLKVRDRESDIVPIANAMGRELAALGRRP
jgi:hypothetical protein